MSRPAGLPKSGGRQRGTPNRATAKRERAIADSGLTPLAYMLDTLRNTAASHEERMEAAKHAAPYVHPKFASVTMTKDDAPGNLTLEQQAALEAERVREALAIMDAAFGEVTGE